MTLYSERKRLADLAQREAAGENLWSMDVPPAARVKLVQIMNGTLTYQDFVRDDWDEVASAVRHARGVDHLIAGSTSRRGEVQSAVRSGDIGLLADVLEATIAVIGEPWRSESRGLFNDVLASHRVAFEIVGDMVVEFESREMHSKVVVPALTLLGGDSRFSAVENAYQDALRELASPTGAANAITDAGTALQEMLRALGCEGNAIGPLLKSARSKCLLGSSDQRLERSIADAIEWVASDRSTKGDTHNSEPAFRDDAWLTIHIVGALIIRLAQANPRGAVA